MTAPPTDLLHSWDVTAPWLIGRSDWALVWQVRQGDGQLAALKHYPAGDMGAEAPGFDLMHAAQAGVKVLKRRQDAVLLDWLSGPSLAEAADDIGITRADAVLVQLAAGLHRTPPPEGLNPLDRHLSGLLDWDVPPALPAFAAARELARGLLAEGVSPRPLHGDLHHGNVRHDGTQWRLFDAKGLWGDPGYELANAFCNPLGRDDWQMDAARICSLATDGAAALGQPPKRLIAWAAVHRAISLIWDVGPDPERLARHAGLPLLSRLLQQQNG